MRLAALASYAILDTPPEEEFDWIAQFAAHICDTPVSGISFIARDRQWFKSRVRFAPSETTSVASIGIHGFEHGVMVVPDTHADERFASNPYVVGEGGFR